MGEKAMVGLTEQPKQFLTREENLIPGSKQRSGSPAMDEHVDQRGTSWLVVKGEVGAWRRRG